MSKRINDKQISKDDDSDGGGSDDGGGSKPFERASEDVLKARKIIKVARRPPGSSGASSSSSVSSSNPFANTNLVAPAPAPANPFASVKLVAGSGLPPTTAPANAFAFPASQAPPVAAAAPASSTLSNPFTTAITASKAPISNSSNDGSASFSGSGSSTTSSTSSNAEKLKKLNAAFLAWITRQEKEHPLALWTEGLKDYIKYSKQIEDSTAAVTAASPHAVSTASPGAPSTMGAKITSAFDSSVSTAPAAAVTAASNSNPFGTASNAPSFSSASSTTGSNMFALPASSNGAAKEKEATAAAAAVPNPFVNPFASSSISTSAPGASNPFAPKTTTASGAADSNSIKVAVPSFSVAPVKAANLPFSFPIAASGSIIPAAPASSGLPALPAFAGFNMPLKGGDFNVQGGSASLASAAAAAAAAAGGGGGGGGGEGGEDGEDGGEPILEPEKVIKDKNDDSEELCNFGCRLMRYDTEDKEWKDTGKGTFRITKDPKTGKSRLLVRDMIGKIMLNAGFYKEMKITKSKKAISFSAFVSVEDIKGEKPAVTEMRMFSVRLSEVNAEMAHKAAEKEIAALEQ